MKKHTIWSNIDLNIEDWRDDYKEYDRRGYTELLEPGVVRIKRENADDCNLIPFYLLEKVQ